MAEPKLSTLIFVFCRLTWASLAACTSLFGYAIQFILVFSFARELRGHAIELKLCRPRSIKLVPGRFQVKRHSRELAYQALPLFACYIKSWEWPGDEAKTNLHQRSEVHAMVNQPAS